MSLRKFFLLFVLSLMVLGCQKASNIVVDSSQRIIDATHLVFIGMDNIDIAANLNVSPPNLSITDSFAVTLSDTVGFSYLAVKVENDSGTVLTQHSFTSRQGNSVTGSFSFIPASVYVGDLKYSFTPYNENGTPGNYETKAVHLYNSALDPPVVDSIIAPDSLHIGAKTGQIDLYAKVHDPFGLSDIQIVYFNTTQPDGTPSSHNPYHMFDDGGASGDPTDADMAAHDGTFTYEGQLPSNTATGIYTFTFYAVNRSGVSSAPVSHNVRIY